SSFIHILFQRKSSPLISKTESQIQNHRQNHLLSSPHQESISNTNPLFSCPRINLKNPYLIISPTKTFSLHPSLCQIPTKTSLNQ
ncbi:hypothetical protein LINGRAHAP2_LOCUS23229, partial [Linum grandiflorum]